MRLPLSEAERGSGVANGTVNEAAPAVPEFLKCCHPGIRCETQARRYRIVVMQGERPPNRLRWMYRSVRESLLEGLRSREKECGYSTQPLLPSNFTQASQILATLRPGDVVIHIGVEWRGQFFQLCRRQLARRKIYCIHHHLASRSQEHASKDPLLKRNWFGNCLFQVSEFILRAEENGEDNHTAGKGVCEVWSHTQGNLWSLGPFPRPNFVSRPKELWCLG